MKLTYCINCFTPMQDDVACPNCHFQFKDYVPASHHLLPETILHGRYLVGRVLGEGGFGITYLGFDLKLERKVAIKEFFPNGSVWRDAASGLTVSCYNTEDVSQMFTYGKENCMKEAKTLAKLDDIDSVVHVLDHFPENNTAYIIMEYIEGVTLKDHVQKLPAKMTFRQVMDLLRPIMRALITIHDRGFIHRDISPDNIMITPDGKAKLLDFGTVKPVPQGGAFTQNPTIKRGFSALEQYSSEGKLGEWTDVYAICATIYYLLTGTVVPEPTDRLSSGGDRIADKLKGLVPEPALQALVHGLAINPQNRLRSMQDLLAQLDSQSKKSDKKYDDSFDEEVVPETKPKPKHWKWIIPVAAVLVIAAAALIIFRPFGSTLEQKNYTYGRDLTNTMSDGIFCSIGSIDYISSYYDSQNADLFSLSGDNVEVVLKDRVSHINAIGNKLYYYNNDQFSIDCYTENEEPIQLYKGGAIGQLLAVDTGETTFLYFSEVNGNLFSIQRLDVNTKEKMPISGGYATLLFTVHNNLIYYVNDKHELWTVGFDGSKDKCLLKDDDVYSVCFVNDSMFLQTGDSVLEATENGKIKETLPDISPVYDLLDGYICPIYGYKGVLYYTDSESTHMYQYDLNERSGGVPFIEATCYDFEIIRNMIVYTTIDTGIPTIHLKSDLSTDDSPFPFNPWTLTEVSEREYGIDYYGNNVNGSFATFDNDRLFYIDDGVIHWNHKAGDTSDFSVRSNASYSCLNFADEVFYTVALIDDVPYICNGLDIIYTGTDIYNLQYYRRDDFEKLLFTDKAADGNYYAYSINTDGSALTRLSHINCAPDSLDIYKDYIIYTDENRIHLYSAYVTGQQINEDYEIYSSVTTQDDLSLAICQACFQSDGNVYITLNNIYGYTSDCTFLSLDPVSGEILSEDHAYLSDFMLCYDGIYATDPIDHFLYYYSDFGDYLNPVRIISEEVEALNRFDYDDKSYLAFRTADGDIYFVEPDTHKAVKANDLVLFTENTQESTTSKK